MLQVRARLGPSPIHGLGVFAAEPIARGAEVWRFTPGFDLELDPALVGRQPERLREWLLVYGYLDPRLERFILCCDDARFINHSAAPNLRPDFGREPHGVDLALRDIAPGEELTVDYALVDGVLPG
ncbi:MAG TPA: SET domain-containing protein [Burkholderiales bacterium]|nr:SET domain-containing protein [Burkholderiales bacterium]